MIKLGEIIGSIATPIAQTLGLPCIDPETKQLRPESNCAKRRDKLNQFSDAFYDAFWPKKETQTYAIRDNQTDRS